MLDPEVFHNSLRVIRIDPGTLFCNAVSATSEGHYFYTLHKKHAYANI